ncbi:uncharacterized protein PAC_17842 [Phialocephala subalpina]|uniref:Heterokaryon incompatibility domain-containing protein n=1 Tax=Phialocephala subalpina TaxID=576137 RepID=A0A1L7XSB9_9HELO|nr:uncharacterized protein PAC_17842 [Phialocephala subalpina]
MRMHTQESFISYDDPYPYPTIKEMASNLECNPDQRSIFCYREVNKPLSARSQQIFRHTPLRSDSNDIRLIAVVPWLSDDGFVQCVIKESTMDINYTCLSYVWGNVSDMWRIKVNDKITWVRRSLFQFLIAAMRTYNDRLFWIDALSINQLDLAERNEQVQKMGQIYSEAEEVFAWLGVQSEMQEFSGWGEGKDEINVMGLEYWKRAWITQEMSLARQLRLIFSSRDQEVEGDFNMVLERGTRNPDSPMEERTRWFMANGSPVGTKVVPLLSRDLLRYHKKGLLDLLCIHGWKRCSEDRDRIFSLLSLSKEDGKIKVDYGQPKVQLARQVLRVSTCSLCFCNVAILVRALNLKQALQTDTEEKNWSQHAIIEFSTRLDQVVRDGLCSVCGVGIGSVRDGSRIVCLQSFCGVFDGHLVWRSGVRKEQCAKTMLLAVNRIESADCSDSQTYRWQLSLDALLHIIYARENVMGDKVYEDFEENFQSKCSDALRYSDEILEQSNTEVRVGDRISLRRKQMSVRLV